MSKKAENLSLAQWIIQKENTKKYRAGEAAGLRHPKVDQKMIDAVGGMQPFLKEAEDLETEGLIRCDWWNMNADLRQIHYAVNVIPKLCEREGVEDPREQQLQLIRQVRELRKEGSDVEWMQPYYEELLGRLCQGKRCTDAENPEKLHCLNAIAHLQEASWMRTFSAKLLGNSKRFEKQYKTAAASFLRKNSPFCEEEMTDDQVLAQHNLLSYSQTLQWKGALRFRIGEAAEIDGAAFPYGMILNAQTLEDCQVTSLAGISRILLIENQANYEDQKFRADTLYIFCHGFFSPKEVLFLRQLAAGRIKTEHWGDMDCGGIRIFLYNKNRIFSNLQPYRMSVQEYERALAQGYGRALEESARKRLEATDAGEMTELKEAILKRNLVIEQEVQIDSDTEQQGQTE